MESQSLTQLSDFHFQGLHSGFTNCQFSSVQLCLTLGDPKDCSMPDLPIHHQLLLLKLMSIQPSHPLSSPSLQPSIFPSIRVFLNELVLRIRWPKYWSFRFNISLSSEYSALVSFRMDLLDLLQHHSLY